MHLYAEQECKPKEILSLAFITSPVIAIGAFRVTKLGQKSAKKDFSRLDQNKEVLAKHHQNSCLLLGQQSPNMTKTHFF